MHHEDAGWPPPDLKVSVVIPTRNGARRVPLLLEALAAQRRAPAWEAIVVEDGSTCLAPEMATLHDRVRIVHQRQQGPAAARNRGAAESTGCILLFVDDDCQPHPTWMEEMVRPFSDPEVVAVKGAYATSQSSTVARFVQCEYEEKFDRLSKKPHVDFVDGYSAAFRREVFERANGYDESFSTPSVEDRDLSLRLSKAGNKMVFNRAAVVDHLHVESVLGYLAKKLKYGRWGIRILGRMPREFVSDDHTPDSQRLQVILVMLLPALTLVSAVATPWLLAAWAATFWGSSYDLVRRCWRAHWRVGLMAPLLVLLRALGLAGGLAFGACESALRGGPGSTPWSPVAPVGERSRRDSPLPVADREQRPSGRPAPPLTQPPDPARDVAASRLSAGRAR